MLFVYTEPLKTMFNISHYTIYLDVYDVREDSRAHTSAHMQRSEDRHFRVGSVLPMWVSGIKLRLSRLHDKQLYLLGMNTMNCISLN